MLRLTILCHLFSSTMWGMPEVRIGYFPDSGASYFFNKFPSGRALGLMYALRGAAFLDQVSHTVSSSVLFVQVS